MNMLKPMMSGILASCFFSFSFVMNRAMELSGGSWLWSSSLRFIFMCPILLLIVLIRGNLRGLLLDMKNRLWVWVKWSFIGFGLFYALVCFAAAYGPGWLIAGTWQVTIVAGTLLVPFMNKASSTPNVPIETREKIPLKALMMSLIILLGVAIMQIDQARHLALKEILLCAVPVVIAAFAYPIGNRKMMEVCGGRLDAYQRVLGMTIASLPLWLFLSFYALIHEGPPSVGQVSQSFIVAICSGVIATVLFFSATDIAKGSVHKLAAVEATQAGEIIFTVIGELLLLSASFPSMLSCIGILLVIVGMILHSLKSGKKTSIEEDALKPTHS
jgi:drug/metabolite transporter (DMT)-like permease